MQTLRRGSAGPTVKRWQAVIGAEQDGKFGPQTERLTKAWQAARGLAADGIVGPLTWAAAGEQPDVGQQMVAEQASSAAVPSATIGFVATGSANADQAAYRVASALPYTEAERQFGLAVARAESFYGRAWSTPSKSTIAASAKFGLTGYEGKGSNNWGSVQGKGDAGSFPHVDHNAAGKPYVGQYRRYSTPELGAAAFFRILYSGNKRGAEGARELRDAVARGSMRDAVFAMHKNVYFELAPEKYLSAVRRNYDALTANVRWAPKLTETGSNAGFSTSGALGTVAAVATVVLGFLAWRLFR